MDYRSRCSVMEACLPISEFKHQTVKLHVDMLNEIESLRAQLKEKDAELLELRRRLEVAEKRIQLVSSLANQDISWDRYENGGLWRVELYSLDSYFSFVEAIDAAIAKGEE